MHTTTNTTLERGGDATLAGPSAKPVRGRRIQRLMAITALSVAAMGASLALTANPAAAAGSGTVSTGSSWSLNVRRSPTTGSGVVRSLSNGSRVTLQCWVNGQTVSGRWGNTSLWHRAAGGYISDGFVYTGVNGPAPGEGRCGSAPAPAPASSSKAQRAVAWAKSQIGSTGWNWWCDKFVAAAYGRSYSGYNTAYAHYQDLARRGLIHTNGTPPAGALAFFAPAPVNGNAGHVQISEGSGTYITSAATVRRVNITWPGSRYLGWSYANPEWPGR